MKLPTTVAVAFLLTALTACGSDPVAPNNAEMECATMERNERERCLEFHNGSFDQYRREQLEKQQ